LIIYNFKYFETKKELMVEPSGLIPEFGVLPLMLGRGPALPRLMSAVLWAVRPGRGIPEGIGLVRR